MLPRQGWELSETRFQGPHWKGGKQAGNSEKKSSLPQASPGLPCLNLFFVGAPVQ